MRLQNNQSCVFIVSRLRYALDSSSSFPCRVPRFGGLATAWNRGATLRPCPHFAIEPDEPPTWAGEQHRQCSRLKDPGRPVRSLGTHRVMHPPAAGKSQNIWIADLHRLAGPLPPSVRLPSEGWSAVVCCDGCNVKRRLKYVNRLGLVFLIICRPDSLGAKNRLVGGWSINQTTACICLGDAVTLRHE